MSRSLADVKAGLSREARERVDARAAEIMAEVEGLQPMRVALNQTQDALARRLRVSQASVAKMEQRTDLLLSTLRQYVEALGGQLSLVASFPGRPEVRISGIGDIPTSREAARSGGAAAAARTKGAATA